MQLSPLFAALGDSDSSSDDDMLLPVATEPQFAKGDAVLGDAMVFCDQSLKKFRTSTRTQAWTLSQQAYAVSAYCNGVTRAAIEEASTRNNFDCGEGGSAVAAQTPGNRRFTQLLEDDVPSGVRLGVVCV